MCQLTENTSLLINSLTEEPDVEGACRKTLSLQKKTGKCGRKKKKKHTYYMGLRKCDQEINLRMGRETEAPGGKAEEHREIYGRSVPAKRFPSCF